MKNIAIRFLTSGYIVSAKHEFQLLKILKVGELNVVYNVDLLHPEETVDSSNMFSDIIDLNAYTNPHFLEVMKLRSMALPSSAILFNGFFENFTIDQIAFPLLNELGLLISKSESFTKSKRTRDAFDMFVAVFQPKDKDSLRAKLYQARKFDTVRCILDNLVDSIKKYREFDKNVSLYLPKARVLNVAPSKYICDFLESVENDKKESSVL